MAFIDSLRFKSRVEATERGTGADRAPPEREAVPQAPERRVGEGKPDGAGSGPCEPGWTIGRPRGRRIADPAADTPQSAKSANPATIAISHKAPLSQPPPRPGLSMPLSMQ